MDAVGRLGNYISQGVYSVAAPFHPFGGAVDIIVVQQEDGTFKCTPWYVKFGKFQGVLKRREKIVTVSVNGKEAGFHMYLDHKGEAYFLKEDDFDEEETIILSPPSAPSSGDEITATTSEGGSGSGRRIGFKDEEDTVGIKIDGENRAAGDAADRSSQGIASSQKKEEFLIEQQSSITSNENELSGSSGSKSSFSSGVKNGKIVSKSPSRKRSIFSLVFRGKSQSFSGSQVVCPRRDEEDGHREEEGDNIHRTSSLERAEIVVDLFDAKWATGDSTNKGQTTVKKKSVEMSCFSTSFGYGSGSVEGGSKETENETSYDKTVCSSIFPSFPQDISVVGPILDDSANENSVQVISNRVGPSTFEYSGGTNSVQHGDSEREGESKSENSVQVICNHFETSTFEDSVDGIVDLEHSVRLSDSGRQQSQTEAQMFMMEESLSNCNECRKQVFGSFAASHPENMASNEEYTDPPNLNIPEAVELKNAGMSREESSSKFNEFREPISGINVTFQTGNGASDQEDTNSPHLNVPESVKFSKVNTDAVLPSADDSQDMVTASLLSSGIPSGISHLGGPLFNALANLDLCMESDEKSNTIPQMEVAAESFVKSSSNGEEQMEHREIQDEALVHNVFLVEKNESYECTTSIMLLDVHSGTSNISNSLPRADPDPCIESDEGTKTLQGVQDVGPVVQDRQVDESEPMDYKKPNEEAVIHILPGKEMDISSFSDHNTSTESEILDGKLVTQKSFIYKSAQEDMGLIDTCSQLAEIMLDSMPRRKFEMQSNGGVPKNAFKKFAQTDATQELEFIWANNQSGKHEQFHIETKETYVNEFTRNGSGEDLDLTFDDDYGLKNSLSLSNQSPDMREEMGDCNLYFSMDQDKRESRMVETNKSNEELAYSDQQPDDPQVPSTENVNVTDIIGDSLDGSMSELSRTRTSPICIPGLHMKSKRDIAETSCSLPNTANLPGLHMKDKKDIAQTSCSLPNTVNHFLDIESLGADHVFSRPLGFDCACLKQRMNHDIPFPNSQHVKSCAPDKETVYGLTASENSSDILKNGNATEAAIASVQPDSGIEISLCGHLLSEGMGTEAAAQAFDSQKLSLEDFHNSGAAITKNKKLVVKIGGRYFPWDAAAPIILGMVSFGFEEPVNPEGAIPVEWVENTLGRCTSDSFVTSGGGWKLWPFRFRRIKTAERKSVSMLPKDQLMVDPEAALQSSFDGALEIKSDFYRRTGRHKVRSNTPTSGQLSSLNLKDGQNMITFTFSTRVLGKQQVDARIYLWKWNTRIVVSDVDGTITKSDVLGQFMPLVGKDWTQSGVAHLFSAIKDNGYQLLFLSARAIAQAYLTRQFLVNVKQDGKALPDGPVVISPDGLFPSLYREVIRRAPHEFKIACLEDIRALFPADCNPFYAGFGNRDTDEISYLKVGIPKGKIFIINPKGEVAVNRRLDRKSYTSLHKLVNGMFPARSSSEQEDFNAWNYWRVPLPDIDV